MGYPPSIKHKHPLAQDFSLTSVVGHSNQFGNGAFETSHHHRLFGIYINEYVPVWKYNFYML
jgi:hypothetical protein